MKRFKAGRYVNQGTYRAYIPTPVNRKWLIDDMEVIRLLSRADRELGRLDMYSEYVNIDLYIGMHIVKEATQSSKIEGTQTKMEDVFLNKDEIDFERRDDWQEVQNYIKAMNKGENLLKELPFSSRLIKQVHKELLQNVRGKHRLPGEFRTSQNWIGGATLNDAVFVPPPHTMINELMSDLEKFANDDTNPMPDLLKIALIHYQFETIHPFLDGNGRVGRLLIPLYLVNKKILKRPILYLSDFFERNRSLYYDNLMRVRTANDINQWFKFFLTGVMETAIKGVKTFDGILQLQREMDIKLKTLKSREGNARKLIDFLYSTPIIRAQQVEKIVGLSSASAYKLINDLERLDILKEVTGGKRKRLFVFYKYLNLF